MKTLPFLFLSLFGTIESHAFTVLSSPPVTFAGDTITIDYDSSSCSGVFSGYTVADLVQGVVSEYWGTVPWIRIRFKVGSDTTTAAASAPDNHITVECGAVPAGAAAVGGSARSSGYTIQAGYVTLGNVMGSYTKASATITTAHEVGHAIGLGHSSHADSVMYGGGGATRGLSDDDEAGITFLYPAFEENFLNCVSIRSIHNQIPPSSKPPYELFLLASMAILFGLGLRGSRWPRPRIGCWQSH